MDILKELDQAGAVLLNQHFVYKSWKHGSGYINMDPLFPDVQVVEELCIGLITPFRDGAGGIAFDTIAAPATGAIVLAVLAANETGQRFGCNIPAVWADKDGDDFVFERAGFTDHLKGKRVLVIEDLLTTGGSVLKVCREAEKHGAEVVGVSVIVNRGGLTAEQLGVPRLEALAAVNFTAVDAEKCQLCLDGVPIVEDIGHGADYKTKHPDYAGGYVKLLA